jgi:hypothetical protein
MVHLSTHELAGVRHAIVGLALALVFRSSALGALVVETEVGGVMNNTVGTAQAISPASFTTPVPPTVFDPPGWPTATIAGTGNFDLGDVDFYSFTTTGGGAMFDIDNPMFAFDTILSLFDSSGTLVGVGDDILDPDPGSGTFSDAFIGVITLSPGSYYVAVSQFDNYSTSTFTADAFVPLTRPDGETDGDGGFAVIGATPGDSSFPASGPDGPTPYTLHISLENVETTPVPEASSFLVWSILGGTTVGVLKLRKWFGSCIA